MVDYAKRIVTEFHFLRCGVCGIPHYIPDFKYEAADKNGKNWYCPNGHVLVFTENQLTKERKRRQWAEQSRDRYENWYHREKRSNAANKGQLTKLKNRIRAGVCPCCKRSFQNLRNHMKNQHPDFKP